MNPQLNKLLQILLCIPSSNPQLQNLNKLTSPLLYVISKKCIVDCLPANPDGNSTAYLPCMNLPPKLLAGDGKPATIYITKHTRTALKPGFESNLCIHLLYHPWLKTAGISWHVLIVVDLPHFWCGHIPRGIGYKFTRVYKCFLKVYQGLVSRFFFFYTPCSSVT